MELMFRSLMHGTGIWTAATNWMNMSRERLFRGGQHITEEIKDHINLDLYYKTHWGVCLSHAFQLADSEFILIE
jgi:hypothetical protein